MVVTIRSLSLQMAFAQRFNEVTCDITHISSFGGESEIPDRTRRQSYNQIRGNDPDQYPRRRGGSSLQGVPPQR